MIQTQEYIAGQQRLPWMVERDGQGTLRLPIERAGGVPTVSITSIKVYRPDGTEHDDMPSQAVADNVPECQWVPATFDGESLGMGWQILWVIDVDGAEETFRTEMALIRRQLFGVVIDADLEQVYPGLSEWLPVGQGDWTPQIYEAWIQLNARLIAQGTRPQLIMSPWAIRNVHMYLALTIIGQRLRVTGGGMWAEHHEMWAKRAEAEWSSLQFSYDSDGDGSTDGTVEGPATHILMDLPARRRFP